MSRKKNNPTDTPAIFRFVAGLHGQAPVPLAFVVPGTEMSHAEFELQQATDSFAWFLGYEAIPVDEIKDRILYVARELHAFGRNLSRQLSKNLRAGVSLELLLKHRLYKQLVDADGRPQFSAEKEFISAFLAQYGISDAADTVSRLRATAALWIAIVQAKLPYPPVLSRLEPLVVDTTPALALQDYGDLVEDAGGEVPTAAAIKAYAEARKAKKIEGLLALGLLDRDRVDHRDWMQGLLLDGYKAQAFLVKSHLQDQYPELQRVGQFLKKVLTVMENKVAEKKTKKDKKGKKDKNSDKPPPARPEPSLPCPVLLRRNGGHLELNLKQAPEVVVKRIEDTAGSLRWTKVSDRFWQLALPRNVSAAHAKTAHMREWLTRSLERLNYQGPELPSLAA